MTYTNTSGQLVDRRDVVDHQVAKEDEKKFVLKFSTIMLTLISFICLLILFIHDGNTTVSKPSAENVHNHTSRIINPRPEKQVPGLTSGTVLIIISKKTKSSISTSTCSGSILSDRVILTAAHCFVPRFSSMSYIPKKTTLLEVIRVDIHVGLTNGQDIDNYHIQSANNAFKQNINLNKIDELKNDGIYSVVRLNKHWFDSLTAKRNRYLHHGDIALIMLPENKKINSVLTRSWPVALFAPGWHKEVPKSIESVKEWTLSDRHAIVVGYGRTTDRQQVSKKGLGYNYFYIIEKDKCKEHMKNIGWGRDLDLLNVQDVFCSLGQGYPARTQVCNGDSGGPIFSYIDLVVRKENTLYQITTRSQVGLTVWVDNNCEHNFNGFLDISFYLTWMQDQLQDLFLEINDRIFPTADQIDNFEQHKSLILEWRQKHAASNDRLSSSSSIRITEIPRNAKKEDLDKKIQDGSMSLEDLDRKIQDGPMALEDLDRKIQAGPIQIGHFLADA